MRSEECISLRIPWALSSPLPLPLIGGHQRKCVGDPKKGCPRTRASDRVTNQRRSPAYSFPFSFERATKAARCRQSERSRGPDLL